jgi:hypothetical protein
MTIVKVSSRSELAQLVRDALEKTQIFSAQNIIKGGELRKWVIHPRAGRHLIKGTGHAFKNPLDMVHVYDMTRAATRADKGRYAASGVNAWRTMRLDTLQAVKVQGVTYTL